MAATIIGPVGAVSPPASRQVRLSAPPLPARPTTIRPRQPIARTRPTRTVAFDRSADVAAARVRDRSAPSLTVMGAEALLAAIVRDLEQARSLYDEI